RCGLARVDGRPQRSEGVILLRGREPEDDAEGLAHRPGGYAAVSRGGSPGRVEAAGGRALLRLGIEGLAAGGARLDREHADQAARRWRLTLRRRRRGRERSVVGEDRPLEVVEGRAGLDAELVDERRAGVPVG